MEIILPFAVGIGIVQCNDLLDLSRKLFFENDHLLAKSEKFGLRTNFQIQKLYKHSINESYVDLSVSNEIKKEILSHCLNFLKVINWFADSLDYEITNMWLNEYSKVDSFQDKHSHQGSLISGTYYVDMPSDGHPIIFSNPHEDVIPPLIYTTSKTFSNFNSAEWKFHPTEGQLFMFPSNLKHYVPKSNTSGFRRSISFDLNTKH